MRKKIVSVLFVILFLACIAIMDYPFIAQLFNEREQSAVAMQYQETADQLGEEERAEYRRLLAAEYNQSLETGTAAHLEPPFSGSGTEAADHAYEQILDIRGDGVLCVIEIPKISLTLPVYHGTTDEVLEKGAGHLKGSSFPVGGGGTHVSIAAHRGLPSKRLFTDLDQLEAGDVFYLDVLGERLAYEVYETEVVTPENTASLMIKEGADLVTLITCTPYGINTHRLYVHGQRISYEEGAPDWREQLQGFWQRWWWVIVSVVLLLWMVFLLRRFHQKPEAGAQL